MIMTDDANARGSPIQLAAADQAQAAGVAGTEAIDEGANIASLAAESAASLRPDLSLLELDHLLELPLEIGEKVNGFEAASGAAYPSIDNDDVPTPGINEDDLPVPYLSELDLPADLTSVGLQDLLNLGISGNALPTIGEIARAAYRRAETREAEPEATDEAAEFSDVGGGDSEELPSEAMSAPAPQTPTLFSIDRQPLTAKTDAKSVAAASRGEDDDEWFDLNLFQTEEEFDINAEFEPASGTNAPGEPAGSGSGGPSGGGGTNVINGTAGDDVLGGTATTDILHGLGGNDVLDGGGGADRLDGGLGNDVLIWDAADIDISGKGGTDTLRAVGDDIDLTAFGGSVSGLEVIDLQSDGGANMLTLSAQDVLDATDNTNVLMVAGNLGDTLEAGTGWSDAGLDGSGNQIYTQSIGPRVATLVVDPDVAANANILT